jgi:hypothetical protein
MNTIYFFICLCLLIPFTIGQYEYFVLQEQWPLEYCMNNYCTKPPEYSFIIDGLFPSNFTGGQPSQCNTGTQAGQSLSPQDVSNLISIKLIFINLLYNFFALVI